MKNFIDEFKAFIMRGNVLDLAVAVVIGAEFNKIVGSLVEDVIMPVVGIMLGGVDFTGLAVTIGDANIKYGNFIQAIINFVLIAFAVFVMVKLINRMREEMIGAPEEDKPSPPPEDIQLLTEIRDELKSQNRGV